MGHDKTNRAVFYRLRTNPLDAPAGAAEMNHREATERLIWEMEWVAKVLCSTPPEELIRHEHELSKIYASLGSLIFSIDKTNTKPCDTE